jgi:CRISPR-associated endonuclease Csn1
LPPWERPVKGGQFLGRPPAVTNPLVRQALVEVRKLVNAIVREFGKPHAIHVELAREVKGTASQRAQRSKDMRERELRRAAAARAIEELGEKPTRGKIDRYLLWQEQRELCIYSGRSISPAQLFGGEVDVDHILPESQSLDDSLMNKVVCFRSENADKGQRTVHEWLAATNPDKYEQVLQRAARLPIEIRNRKRPRFSQTSCQLDHFINRQLTDTAYITSFVVAYLKAVCPDVLGTKGQLTAELRHQWGLDKILSPDGTGAKNRADHRHHAVDAIVIALTDRSRLQQLARRRSGESLPPPWPTFWNDAAATINAINVSHRARRKVAGRLHEETIYGATQKASGGTKQDRPWAKNWVEEDGVYVLRKPLEALSLSEVERIRDERVRDCLLYTSPSPRDRG